MDLVNRSESNGESYSFLLNGHVMGDRIGRYASLLANLWAIC